MDSVQLDISTIDEVNSQLETVLKPYQQEQNRRQKKIDFVKKCIQSVNKNDFFQLDELLNHKQLLDSLDDDHFKVCEPLFACLRTFASEKIDSYRLEFKDNFLELAAQAGLPLELDLPRFSVLKGIDGTVDFANRTTTINQIKLKSIDPRRIVSQALNLKRKLYDSVFEPHKFINALFECYQAHLKQNSQALGDAVPIYQLYIDYVWSLQSQTFLLNMDKNKFKGYAIEQFSVDLWRFFESDVSATEGGYRIRLNSGRGKSTWLIDQDGEKRQITHVAFIKH